MNFNDVRNRHIPAIRNDQIIRTDTTATEKELHTNKNVIFFMHLYRKTRHLYLVSTLQS